MKQELWLTSEMPPSVNHYLAIRAILKNGRPMAVNYKTKEALKYQKKFIEHVKQEVERQGWTTDLDNPRHFYVDAIFYMDKKRKDANNLWKCLLDAITETQLVWRDDDIVCERVNKIVYDADNPRVELRIYYVDYIGVFEDEEQLYKFKKNNCIDCKRYKRNCAILRNAIDGRIQSEINGDTCEKCTNHPIIDKPADGYLSYDDIMKDTKE